MCILCGQSHLVDIMIIDKNSSNVYCPNCIIRATLHNFINLCNHPQLKDDITGEPGAILFITQNEQYCLNRQTMQRLILKNLTAEEWNVLHDKYGNNRFAFMIHEDFYDEEGNALQPVEYT